jgi:hypothetical protein
VDWILPLAFNVLLTLLKDKRKADAFRAALIKLHAAIETAFAGDAAFFQASIDKTAQGSK